VIETFKYVKIRAIFECRSNDKITRLNETFTTLLRTDTELDEPVDVEKPAEVDGKITAERAADSERQAAVSSDVQKCSPAMAAPRPRPEEDAVQPTTKEDQQQQQPNYTNRWSLQEHPNRGTTPVRNSPSLGSIPKHKRTSKCSKDELSDLPETWDEECQKHLVDFAER